MSVLKQIVLVVLVIGLGSLATFTLLANPPEAEREESVVLLPGVQVLPVEREDYRPVVSSHGSVRPAQETWLSAQVSARVVEMAPAFSVGGFFEEGEVLLRLERFDYEQALVEAQAEVARAELRLATEEREAQVAREEWADFSEGEPDPLLMREPQMRQASAEIASARARVERANRDLERCVVRAPYACRVAERNVALGQLVGPMDPVARLLSTEVAEVRLPFPDAELPFLEIPLAGLSSGPPAEVELWAEFSGRRVSWPALLVRTEGEIDPRTRMLTMVAQVADPYNRAGSDDAPAAPLVAGLFVEARVDGRWLRDVFVVPRVALRDGSQLVVVDADDKLSLREVQPLRFERDVVLLESGLEAGERLCLTQLEVVVEGMQVRVLEPDATP